MIPIGAAAAVSLAIAGASPARCAGICGKVVDAGTGRPIGSFTVALFSADRQHGQPVYALPEGYPVPPGPFVGTTRITSPDGSFEVDTGGAPNVHVAISAPGYLPHESGPFPRGSGELRVTLEQARKIRVCVTDARGAPVAGAKIFRSSADTSLIEVLDTIRDARPLSITDANGEAAVEEPLMPWTEIIVLKESFVADRVVVRRDHPSVSVQLRDGVSLEVRVLSEDHTPVRAAALEVRCEGYEPWIALTRADGTFRYDALPPARCELAASRELVERDYRLSLDRVRASVTVDLAAGVRLADLVIPAADR